MTELALLQKENEYLWVIIETVNKYVSEGWIDTQLRKHYLFRIQN